jgi:SAM-dependent methyltransferase
MRLQGGAAVLEPRSSSAPARRVAPPPPPPASDLERLRLQSRVWEAAGRALLRELPRARRALDVGCGALGWLRLLAEWVLPGGEVIGTEADPRLLAAARALLQGEGAAFAPVRVESDDPFARNQACGTCDLVHARFQVCAFGRGPALVQAYRRLARPGGVVVLEDPVGASWAFEPRAPALERLVAAVLRAFEELGGDFHAGDRNARLLADAGIAPTVCRHVLRVPAHHPFLRLPLQFAAALRPRLLGFLREAELAALVGAAERELAAGVGGTSFTLVQTWGRVP